MRRGFGRARVELDVEAAVWWSRVGRSEGLGQQHLVRSRGRTGAAMVGDRGMRMQKAGSRSELAPAPQITPNHSPPSVRGPGSRHSHARRQSLDVVGREPVHVLNSLELTNVLRCQTRFRRRRRTIIARGKPSAARCWPETDPLTWASCGRYWDALILGKAWPDLDTALASHAMWCPVGRAS